MSIETKGARAVRMRDAGLSNADIAAVLGMSKDSTRRLISESRSSSRLAEHELAAVKVLEREMPGFYQEFKANKETPEPRAVDYQVALRAFLEAAGDVPKKTTHIMIPDTQVKPGVDIEHLRWAGEYIAEHESDVVIAIGDWWDMESLSEYDRGKKSFEGRRYKADIEAGNRGMDLFMAGINKCKKRPRLVFTLGNHEQRIERALEVEPRLEGVLGYHDFNLVEHGWEVHDFLTPVEIDGVTYCHYFPQPMSGRPYTGVVETMIKNIGFSFTQGHAQGKRIGSRELSNGRTLRGLVAGSFYSHQESYKGVQGNKHWRGIIVKHEVFDGNYDLLEVSLDYLQRKYSHRLNHAS